MIVRGRAKPALSCAELVKRVGVQRSHHTKLSGLLPSILFAQLEITLASFPVPPISYLLRRSRFAVRISDSIGLLCVPTHQKLCRFLGEFLAIPRWHCGCRGTRPIIQLALRKEFIMPNLDDQKGKIGYIILWLLGVPASILILIFLLRGCT